MGIILRIMSVFAESERNAKQRYNKVMVKLSELTDKLKEQNTKLDQIALDVQALKDGVPNTDPAIPVAAEAALTDLGTKVTNIRTILDATTPPANP